MIDHKEILNGFMSEMQHYIRHNVTKTDWHFESSMGLCSNLSNYTKQFTYSPNNLLGVRFLLSNSLMEAGFTDRVYPFEVVYGDIDPNDRYFFESRNNLLYSNPLRLSFIENWKPL